MKMDNFNTPFVKQEKEQDNIYDDPNMIPILDPDFDIDAEFNKEGHYNPDITLDVETNLVINYEKEINNMVEFGIPIIDKEIIDAFLNHVPISENHKYYDEMCFKSYILITDVFRKILIQKYVAFFEIHKKVCKKINNIKYSKCMSYYDTDVKFGIMHGYDIANTLKSEKTRCNNTDPKKCTKHSAIFHNLISINHNAYKHLKNIKLCYGLLLCLKKKNEDNLHHCETCKVMFNDYLAKKFDDVLVATLLIEVVSKLRVCDYINMPFVINSYYSNNGECCRYEAIGRPCMSCDMLKCYSSYSITCIKRPYLNFRFCHKFNTISILTYTTYMDIYSNIMNNLNNYSQYQISTANYIMDKLRICIKSNYMDYRLFPDGIYVVNATDENVNEFLKLFSHIFIRHYVKIYKAIMDNHKSIYQKQIRAVQWIFQTHPEPLFKSSLMEIESNMTYSEQKMIENMNNLLVVPDICNDCDICNKIINTIKEIKKCVNIVKQEP